MTAFTALAWTCFTNQHEQGPAKAFDPSWWFWLVATGLGLGATVSVKWVGLFTIAWVGSLTVLQLWVLLGDTKTITPVGIHVLPLSDLMLTFNVTAPLVQALSRTGVLPHRDSYHLLHGHVCHSLRLPGQPWRW